MRPLRQRIAIAMNVFVAIILLAPPQGIAHAREIQFTERITAGDHTLVIKGTGVLRYLKFIEACAGALYTLPGLDPRSVLTDTPKRLEGVDG